MNMLERVIFLIFVDYAEVNKILRKGKLQCKIDRINETRINES